MQAQRALAAGEGVPAGTEWVPAVIDLLLVAWFRLADASESIRATFPAAYADGYAAVTALGSATVLTFGLALLYWLWDRRAAAVVVSYGFGALGVTLALKHGLALARPPETAQLLAIEGAYGFPSGHAIAAAVVYGGLAAEAGWLADTHKLLATALLIVAVALSRVVIGAHYLGDVIAGLIVGFAVLAAMRWVTRGDPVRGFAAAAVLAIPALVLTGLAADAVTALGGAVGGVVGGRYVDALPELRSRAEGALLVVCGVALVAVLNLLGDALADVPALVAAVDAVLVAGILLLPALVSAVDVGRLPAPDEGTEGSGE